MEFQRSSSLVVPARFTFNGFETVFGGGAAIESHKSSSSCLITFAVFFGRKLATDGGKENIRRILE